MGKKKYTGSDDIYNILEDGSVINNYEEVKNDMLKQQM